MPSWVTGNARPDAVCVPLYVLQDPHEKIKSIPVFPKSCQGGGSTIPNTRSAARQLRKSLRRRRRNELRKSAIRYWRKQILKLLAEGNKEEALKVFPNYQKAVDKAASHGAIHKNKADRLKARMWKRILAA
ncbi:30S ribosomal protein S20 [Candidatus Bipolaricaulota sp. J31]